MLSPKAAAFTVEALLGNSSTNKEKDSEYSKVRDWQKLISKRETSFAEDPQSSNQHTVLKRKVNCSTSLCDSLDSENKTRTSPKRAGSLEHDSNIQDYKRPRYENIPTSLALRAKSLEAKHPEKSDSLPKSFANETDFRQASSYLNPENDARRNRSTSECQLIQTDSTVDNINTNKSSLLFNFADGMETTLKPSLGTETNLKNSQKSPNTTLLRLDTSLTSRFHSVSTLPISRTWTEGFQPRYHPPEDCIQSRFGHRTVRTASGSHFSNEGSHHTIDLSRPHLALSTEKQNDHESESHPRILTQKGITVALQYHELWAQFHQHQTEMIITKNGRRMFPVVKIKVYGLNPEAFYMIYLEMESIDGRRYRYAYPSSTWVVAGTGDTNSEDQAYIHPDSPATGKQWMEMISISFDKLKLTNSKNKDAKGQVFLYSMQKYIPRLWIQCLGDSTNQGKDEKLLSGAELPKLLDRNSSTNFCFPETSFITVTAYQNQRITRLKINSNPFAKGFRDNSKYREAMERQLVLPGYGMEWPYLQFPWQVERQTPYIYSPSFPVGQMMPFPPSIHLRPIAPTNKWPPFTLPGKPSGDFFPSVSSFLHPLISHSEANHGRTDLHFKRCDT